MVLPVNSAAHIVRSAAFVAAANGSIILSSVTNFLASSS